MTLYSVNFDFDPEVSVVRTKYLLLCRPSGEGRWYCIGEYTLATEAENDKEAFLKEHPEDDVAINHLVMCNDPK